jgi:RNA polymerase sigma-70 factor (ECF subfamily)
LLGDFEERQMLHYSKTQDESALLAMAQGGDGNALVELLNQYAGQAYRVAFRITNNHQDAEDVLQESHLNAYRRLSQFRGESRFSAWLLKIVARQAVTALRRRASRREVPLENVLDAEDEMVMPRYDVDPREGPEMRALKSEIRRILSRAIEKLEPTCRVVLLLREIGGLSMNEIAGALGLSVSAVKARLFRARRKLHKWMLKRFGKNKPQAILAVSGF